MMKQYKVGYFFKQSSTSFIRNMGMSIASVFVLAACLIIMGSFSLLIFSINYNLDQMYTMDKVIVYLTEGTKIDDVKEKLDGELSDNIEEYLVITKAQALEQMKEKYEEHPEIFDPLGTDNPLPDTIEIRYKGGTESLEKLKEGINKELVQSGLIEEEWVSSYDVITEKIEGLRKSITQIFIWIWLLVLAVAVLVIVNTIKLSVRARGDEIEVMRYIGASNWFITLPFVIESIYVALGAILIALPIQWYIYQYLFVNLVKKIPYIKLLDVWTVAPYVTVGFVAMSFLIGIFASILSVKKYARR